MIIQISSGQGQTECELIARKPLSVLEAKFDDIEMLSMRGG